MIDDCRLMTPMACERIDPLVTPFIDGELPEADRRAVEDHLRACPPCHSRVVAEREVQALIRASVPALKKTAAPDALHASCWALARFCPESDRPAAALAAASGAARAAVPATLPARLAPYALAASLVLVVGGAFLYQATDRSARVMAAELTADHMKCFALNGALGTHDAAAAVESSMVSGFDWRMHLPTDPARAGLELVGSRTCMYAEGKIAHIMYRHQGHPVSLFMLPRSARTEELVEVVGHEAAIWCAGDRTFVLIAREPRAEVARLASFVQAGLH
jgi:anti-sigma factor RsiW